MLLEYALPHARFRNRLMRCVAGTSFGFTGECVCTRSLARYVIVMPRTARPHFNSFVWPTLTPSVQIVVNNSNGCNHGANANQDPSSYDQGHNSNSTTAGELDEIDPVATIVPDNARTIVDELLTSIHEENERD